MKKIEARRVEHFHTGHFREEAEGRHFLQDVINLPLAPQIDSVHACVYN